jgi:hypothetical protein
MERNAKRHAKIHALMAQGLSVCAIARRASGWIARPCVASPALTVPAMRSPRVTPVPRHVRRDRGTVRHQRERKLRTRVKPSSVGRRVTAVRVRTARCTTSYSRSLFQLEPIGVHAGKSEKFVPEATIILAGLQEARLAEDAEQIVRQELRRVYRRRCLANQDPERLTNATIAICTAWNAFSNHQLDSNPRMIPSHLVLLLASPPAGSRP